MIQFVVAPDLMKIVAFNHDAYAWGHPNGGEGPGVLYITFLPGKDESDLRKLNHTNVIVVLRIVALKT